VEEIEELQNKIFPEDGSGNRANGALWVPSRDDPEGLVKAWTDFLEKNVDHPLYGLDRRIAGVDRPVGGAAKKKNTQRKKTQRKKTQRKQNTQRKKTQRKISKRKKSKRSSRRMR